LQPDSFAWGRFFVRVIFGLKRVLEHHWEKWPFSGRRQGLPIGREVIYALFLIYTTEWYVFGKGCL
ncbi:MAG: hypothetical protein ACRESB_15010, partial [Pseudomonas sp.]